MLIHLILTLTLGDRYHYYPILQMRRTIDGWIHSLPKITQFADWQSQDRDTGSLTPDYALILSLQSLMRSYKN